ncbi:MAG: xanthine dehydrogenase family protein molybdopterin-binding subunit [bacterium]|nr:xanthine dehydrogenase family protein molybdopterin-binding subunit [bacterium]
MSETISDLSRRSFLKGSGALVLGIGLGACANDEAPSPAIVNANVDPGLVFEPNAFVRIAGDDTVTLVSKHMEMGQGPYTGLATLVAEELDADWAQMRAEAAPADDARFGNLLFGGVQGTGGSTAIRNAYMQMRQAGATARQMLVEAAAETWGVPTSEITVSDGRVRHATSGRESGFGALAEAASKRPVPETPVLKDPRDFVLIGKELPRIDTLAKSTGQARFTIDVYKDDMLVVMIERPPAFGAKVASFDATKALEVPGVVAVEEVPAGVAVYASETWTAIQGRRALSVEWDFSEAETRSSAEIKATFLEATRRAGEVAVEAGDVDATLAAAAAGDDVVYSEAEFTFPFLAHAMMEPLDGILEIDPENPKGVLATLASQGPGREHPHLAAEMGLPKEDVRFDIEMAGGSFGRRSTWDAHFIHELGSVFKAQPGGPADRRPTKLQWTREDDVRGGYYRPIVAHRVRGAMDRAGRLVGWDQTIAAQPFRPGKTSGIDRTIVEGADNLAYATSNLRVTQHLMPTGVPTLWWRSVGHTHTGFAVEAFIDQLLEAVGQDAVEGRLALLGDKPRHRGVLERAAEIAGWGRRPEEGTAFGVAVHESFGSFVAQIVEVERARQPVDRPKVRRVWCAVDCGVPVNPNVIRAQMEGGIGFGLGATLYSEIHLDEGGLVRESNFDRYKNLRIDDMPEVEVAIIRSTEDPTGVGEPGVPPIGPAVANAWRRLTGQAVSQLPFVQEV